MVPSFAYFFLFEAFFSFARSFKLCSAFVHRLSHFQAPFFIVLSKVTNYAENEEALPKNKILMECLFITRVAITEVSRFLLTGLYYPQ